MKMRQRLDPASDAVLTITRRAVDGADTGTSGGASSAVSVEEGGVSCIRGLYHSGGNSGRVAAQRVTRPVRTKSTNRARR